MFLKKTPAARIASEKCDKIQARKGQRPSGKCVSFIAALGKAHWQLYSSQCCWRQQDSELSSENEIQAIHPPKWCSSEDSWEKLLIPSTKEIPRLMKR